MSFAPTDPPYCRLTVLAPRTRVDVALPADLPVAELVPMVLELVGEPAFGARPAPWRLLRATGDPLPVDGCLHELGVLDGALLRIAPDGPAPAAPVFDDPVEALAATAGAAGPGVPRFRSVAVPLLGVAAALVLAATPATALARLAAGAAPAVPESVHAASALVAALAATAALAWAAWLVRRRGQPVGTAPAVDTDPWADPEPRHQPPPGPGPSAAADDPAANGFPPGAHPPPTEPHPTDTSTRPGGRPNPSVHTDPSVHTATTAALAAVPLAVAAGWAALPDVTGPVQVLVAAGVAGGVAALAQLALRVLVPALVGVLAVAAPVGVAALAVARFGIPPGTAAIGVGAVALATGPLLPRAALWLSGIPRPVVPADADELVAADHGPDLLPAAELAERAELARGYLAGLVGGGAVLAGLAALPAAASPGWAGPVLAAVTVALLGLRARSLVDPRPARALAASALLTGVALAALLTWSGGPWARPVAVLGLVLAAAAILRASGRELGSPVRRRAVDLGEGLLTAAVIPLAFATMDLFALVRAL